MKRITIFLMPILTFVLLINPSCKDDYGGTNQELGNITIGPVTEVSSTSIGISGGTITVSKPGTPVDGMEIVIPEKSYPSSQTFKISWSEIVSHKFGDNFKPISPMITIVCDGGYASELMSIAIPVKIPDGDIAIGFYLDESTGKLEGIPVESVASNSITLLTRHFLSGNKLRSVNSQLKSGEVDVNKGSNIIVASVSKQELSSKALITSGFKPGTDDWEFVNWGSYLAPSGHCGGQNLTAMWYYHEKKASDGQLFNKFSTNDVLWQDNAIGFRFCSVIQADVWANANRAINRFFWNNLDRNQERDQLKLFSIAGAMLITGEPQGMAIYRESGQNADGYPLYDAHDLICYQVSVNEGKLFISDPNTPGDEKIITYKDNKFEPYLAKANGAAEAFLYPYITWYAKAAWIEWDIIGTRYAQVMSGTIGNVAPNKFPAYKIWVKGKVDAELFDGFTQDNDTLRCTVECPTAELPTVVDGKKLISFYLTTENGYKLETAAGGESGYTILNPGRNKIGCYIFSRKTGVVDGSGNPADLFIDFKWFYVDFSMLKIAPNPISELPEKEIKFTAMSNGTAPRSAKYVWNFGDGTAAVTLINDSIVKHKFTKEGVFTVGVKLYDNSTGKLFASASATAKIASLETFDYAGRTYTYKTIGTQTWMTENLAYLPSVDSSKKESYIIPYIFVYGYEGNSVADAKATANYTTYGVLYNWSAALTVCPPGWHLPTQPEWEILENFLAASGAVGGQMKETGTAHWLSPNAGATNASGFTALPSGKRQEDDGFKGLGTFGTFWSATKSTMDEWNAWVFALWSEFDGRIRSVSSRADGFSVRCVKD